MMSDSPPETVSEGAASVAAAKGDENSGKQKKPLSKRVNRRSPPSAKTIDNKNGINDNPTESMRMMSLYPKEKLIFQMFGGKFGPQHNLPGMHFSNLALTCLSRAPVAPAVSGSQMMTPREFLLSCGIVKSEITESLFRYADRREQIPGVSVQNLAIKLLWDLITAERCSDLDDLTSANPYYSFQGDGNGATARYFPVPSKNEDTQAEAFRNLKTEEEARLLDGIETWLGAVPKDHIRFLHGTDSFSAFQIIVNGIYEEEFNSRAVDFGRAFYCTNARATSFRYGTMRSFCAETQGKRGCIIAFDVPTKDYDSMEKYVVPDVHWKRITYECHVEGPKAARRHFGKAVQVVEGSISDATTWHGSVDDLRTQGSDMQYAFRGAHGNTLLADRAKVKVAVFDVEVDETDDEENDGGFDDKED